MMETNRKVNQNRYAIIMLNIIFNLERITQAIALKRVIFIKIVDSPMLCSTSVLDIIRHVLL